MKPNYLVKINKFNHLATEIVQGVTSWSSVARSSPYTSSTPPPTVDLGSMSRTEAPPLMSFKVLSIFLSLSQKPNTKSINYEVLGYSLTNYVVNGIRSTTWIYIRVFCTCAPLTFRAEATYTPTFYFWYFVPRTRKYCHPVTN